MVAYANRLANLIHKCFVSKDPATLLYLFQNLYITFVIWHRAQFLFVNHAAGLTFYPHTTGIATIQRQLFLAV